VGTDIVRTPFRAPKANANAERWIRSARQECLDHILILNGRHLHHVLKEYVAFYIGSRLHQGISQQTPIPRIEPNGKGVGVRRDVLGGIVYETYPRAEIHSDEVFPYYTLVNTELDKIDPLLN
jgi:hypothetical protein